MALASLISHRELPRLPSLTLSLSLYSAFVQGIRRSLVAASSWGLVIQEVVAQGLQATDEQTGLDEALTGTLHPDSAGRVT